jgi:rhodanese-related sulfurtransferase
MVCRTTQGGQGAGIQPACARWIHGGGEEDLPPELRSRVAQWFATASEPSGLAPATLKPEAVQYKRVAELGLFTPVALPGVQRVNAKEAQQLQGQGALLVDTRTEKEFRAKRMKGAVWAPYIEKSLKDVAFDPATDDFSALDKLPAKPMVFACNGAECWKSYKAAKLAATKGHKNVYWLRGGLPEWAAEGLPTEKD